MIIISCRSDVIPASLLTKASVSGLARANRGSSNTSQQYAQGQRRIVMQPNPLGSVNHRLQHGIDLRPGNETGTPPARASTSPPSPGMRIFKPCRSARELISLLNQPAICTPELPAANGTRLKGAYSSRHGSSRHHDAANHSFLGRSYQRVPWQTLQQPAICLANNESGTMPHLCRALRHCIKDFKRSNWFPGSAGLDVLAAITHLLQVLRKPFRRHTGRVSFRPVAVGFQRNMP